MLLNGVLQKVDPMTFLRSLGHQQPFDFLKSPETHEARMIGDYFPKPVNPETQDLLGRPTRSAAAKRSSRRRSAWKPRSRDSAPAALFVGVHSGLRLRVKGLGLTV